VSRNSINGQDFDSFMRRNQVKIANLLKNISPDLINISKEQQDNFE